MKKNSFKYFITALILIVIVVAGLIIIKKPVRDEIPEKKDNQSVTGFPPNTSDTSPARPER